MGRVSHEKFSIHDLSLQSERRFWRDMKERLDKSNISRMLFLANLRKTFI